MQSALQPLQQAQCATSLVAPGRSPNSNESLSTRLHRDKPLLLSAHLNIDIMLSRVVNLCRGDAARLLFQRHFAVSAIVCQQKVASDPIQALFAKKVREYADKSKASGGKIVDGTVEDEKNLQDDMQRVLRQFGAKAESELSEFPQLKFADPEIDSIDMPTQDVTDVDYDAVRQDYLNMKRS